MKHASLFLLFVLLLSSCAPASTSIPSTSIPKPTSTPFVMPIGDFKMSWNTYNSEYDSLGGILTIRRQGSKYTQTLVMSDGSCGITDLTVISKGNEIKLTDRPGDPSGDYMAISNNGDLYFDDNQGVIYSVPLLNTEKASDTECAKPQAEQGKELTVAMSLTSVDSIGGNHVRIIFSTNLPDGMQLMMDLKDSANYWATGKATVYNGSFETTFGNVSTGTYHLTITSPVVEVQPENVRAILGENGKNMVGNFVAFDQSMNSYSVAYSSDIEVK